MDNPVARNLRREHLVYAFLMAATLIGLILIGGASFALSMHNRAAAGFVWQTVLAHPSGFLPVFVQLVVIAMIHVGFFWAIYRLGVSGTRYGRWFERPAQSVAFTWLAACWLVLDVQNDLFPISVAAYVFGPITDAPASSLLSGVAALWLVHRSSQAFRYLWQHQRRYSRSWLLIASVPLVAIAYSAFPRETAPAQDHRGSRNVVIIGLDSIRRELAVDATGAAVMPALAAVQRGAFVEANVVAPLAHTFPSWTTILTGLHPQKNGARFNLSARAKVDSEASLAWTLKKHGYRTIYATDETRFSNIGANFGFDEVISPQPGVSDFLLSQFFDQPLVNLAVQLPGMEYLLPALTGNRAFAQAYEPARFLGRLERAIGAADGRPTFIVVHLCLAHWPFYSAERNAPIPGFPDGVYFPAAAQADKQFADLRKRLMRLGYLRPDDLEVVLADHGEAIADDLANAPSIRRHGDATVVPPAGLGHGTSLLTASQWKIFALFRGTSAAGPITVGRSDRLSSLEDVAPTILSLLGETVPAGHRTMTVANAIRGEPKNEGRAYVLMETGFTPAGFNAANPDGDAALRIAESSFDVQDDGRVEMKAWVYDQTIPYKQIGVTDGQKSLVVTGIDRDPVIVAQDFKRNTWDIYPAATAVRGTSLPLLAEACSEPSLRSRIPDWCSQSLGSGRTQ